MAGTAASAGGAEVDQTGPWRGVPAALDETSHAWLGSGVAVGLGLAVGVGAAVGVVDDDSVGVAEGVAMGVAVGAGVSTWADVPNEADGVSTAAIGEAEGDVAPGEPVRAGAPIARPRIAATATTARIRAAPL
jgi:hypothetical protein